VNRAGQDHQPPVEVPQGQVEAAGPSGEIRWNAVAADQLLALDEDLDLKSDLVQPRDLPRSMSPADPYEGRPQVAADQGEFPSPEPHQ
jgi:hypothetical protein